MPNLNTKLLLRLVAVAIAIGAALIILHQVQAGRVPDALLWQANSAAEKGKTDKAIFYLKQYLEFRPDDHDTAIRLADLMAERAVTAKDIANAHFLYERVLREAPHRADVARKLIALCIRMGRHADALAHAERLLKDSPTDGKLLAQVAECQLTQNRHEDARKSFEKAIQHASDNVRAFEQYARLLNRHFNKPQDAQLVLDRMVQSNPGQAAAYLIRARFLKGQDRNDECMKDLDRVFLLDPENGEALVMSAEILQARGEVRRAKEALRETIALYPRFVHGYRALSWLDLLSGNQAEARATLERGVEMLPEAPELLTPLADLWIDQGELDRVGDVIKKLEAQKNAAARVSYLRGRMLMKQVRWNDAVAVLESLRADTVALPGLAPQLNLLIAGCHDRRGDRDAQFEALRRALAADPKHLGARVALANAHLNAGRLSDAIREYELATRSPFAGLGVQMTYASLRLSAVRQANGPANEWQAVATLLSKLREQHKSAIEPVVLLAECRAAQRDFAGAIKLLRDEASARPGDVRIWSALSAMVARGHGTLAAMDVLGEAQLAAGDSVELRLARARLWADDFVPGNAERLARLEELSPTAGDADRTRLFGGLAELYAVIRDEAGEKRMRERLAALNRSEEGPSTAVQKALREIEAAKPGDRRLAEWQELARSVLANNPDQVEAHLLMAKAAERRGEASTAARHFDSAAHLDPMSVRSQAARLGFFLRTGKDESAQRTLASLDADPRITPLKLRAIVEGANRESDALSKCLPRLVNHLQREPRSALWVGKILEGRKNFTDALAMYRQVNEMHPAFADGWSARILASARLGEKELNESVALAAKALPRKAFFGVCAESGATIRATNPNWSPPLSGPDDVRAYAEACLSACEARGRLQDAVPVLSAIANDKNSRAEDVAWAKQTLAALNAAHGSSEQKRDAVAALKDGNRPSSVADARSRVAALMVAYRSVGGDDRRVVIRELISLLDSIVRSDSATSNDWFQLAQLHRVAGDRARCRKCLEELTKREPRNLFYLAVNVDDLLAEGRMEAARPLVTRLEGGLADVHVAAAAARFHTLANDPAKVLDIVDRFVRVADPGTTDGIARQRQAADVLDQMTRLAATKRLSGAVALLDGACERYRASLRAYPDAVAPMSALLASAGRVDAAFAELERQKSKLSPLALTTAGVGVLRSGQATPRQFQTVKGWIDEGLAADAKSMPLKLNLGELHALQQDFASAEAVYREVLKNDPKNQVALNNLAWILAPRADSAEQALRLADRAIELYGASGEMLDTRARILISAGEYDRAVADLTDAINQRGTPLRYFHLSLAQMGMSKPEEAVRTFREARARGLDAKAIHPHDLPAYKALSQRAVQ